jgi:adenosylmethionine-8-amino-7-oxononanoate aminotransferase
LTGQIYGLTPVLVGKLRQTGMILALEQGALLRPLGDVIYFMPPYVIKPEEIDFLARVAWEDIDAATA